MITKFKNYKINESSIKVGEKNGFILYFDANKQRYLVYKDNVLIRDDLFSYKDAKTYID